MAFQSVTSKINVICDLAELGGLISLVDLQMHVKMALRSGAVLKQLQEE